MCFHKMFTHTEIQSERREKKREIIMLQKWCWQNEIQWRKNIFRIYEHQKPLCIYRGM